MPAAAAAGLLTVALAACSGGAGAATSSGSSTKAGAAAALVPKDVAKRGTLTIATDPTYPPLESTDAASGALQGLEIELGDELAADLGLKAHWQSVAFDSIVPGLQAKRYDAGFSGFWVFDDRTKVVDMITYFESGSQYMVKTGSGVKVDSREDLCGTTVALQSGSSEVQMDQDENAKCTAAGKGAIVQQVYKTQDEANLAVTTGRAQSTGVGAEVAGYTVKNSDGKLALGGGVFDSSPAGIALQKGSPLTKAMYAGFQDLQKSGRLKTLFEKYGITDQQIALKLDQ